VSARPPEIGVVVVADGPWEATLRTLAALARAAAGVPHVLIGVDDGTRDETACALPRLPGMVTLRSDLPRGFATAALAGAAAARTPWLAFLRTGAEPRRGWLSGLLEAARAHPDAAALAGLLVRPDGLLVSSGEPAVPSTRVEPATALPAVGLAVQTEAFAAAEGFRAAAPDGEGPDLCRRLGQQPGAALLVHPVSVLWRGPTNPAVVPAGR